MAPNSVFVDAYVVLLKAIILWIFREKSWFGLSTNYKRKCVRKPILANLGTCIFKNFSLVETVVVPVGETKANFSLFAFISLASLKVGLATLLDMAPMKAVKE